MPNALVVVSNFTVIMAEKSNDKYAFQGVAMVPDYESKIIVPVP